MKAIRNGRVSRMLAQTTGLISWPSSRALRWLREACPRRRDTATAPGAPYAAFDPAAAACRGRGLTDGVPWWMLLGSSRGFDRSEITGRDSPAGWCGFWDSYEPVVTHGPFS